MRIISGSLKGRHIAPPSNGWKTRPTTDRAKEGLFNILHNSFDFESTRVLDLFAGTGNIGYEFLSRGAIQVDFVERYGACIQFIKQSLSQFQLTDKAVIHQTDVFKFVKNCSEKYDLIFADPPYRLKQSHQLPDLIFDASLFKSPKACLIIEHDNRLNFEKHTGFAQFRQYGQSGFSFFGPKE